MASGFEILLKILECAMCGFNFLVERVKLSLWDPNFLRNFRLLLRHPNFRKKRRESLARAKGGYTSPFWVSKPFAAGYGVKMRRGGA